MEKTFNRYAKQGQIPTDIVPNLIKELQPEIDVNHDDLMVMLGVADKTGSNIRYIPHNHRQSTRF